MITARARTGETGKVIDNSNLHVDPIANTRQRIRYEQATGLYYHKADHRICNDTGQKFIWPEELTTWLSNP